MFGMISDEAAVKAACDCADDALKCGEMPIGAAVFCGDDLIASAFTQERKQRRRIVHADLLALEAADKLLGFSRPHGPLTLAVNLEPCLMCMGAAITLGVSNVVYGLESPNDGAVELIKHWNPPVMQSFFATPTRIVGGVYRERARLQFETYAHGSGSKGMREWALSLSQQKVPDISGREDD